MTEKNDAPSSYFGTYFEKDAVLRLVKWTRIFSWIVLAVYIIQFLISIGIFILQYVRGFMSFMGITDFLQQLTWMFQPPLIGLVYFVTLQAVGKVLLILMDIEDNTRRAARK